MKYYDVIKKIKDDTGLEFKVYNSMEELENGFKFPYKIVVCGDNIEHLTILKHADILEKYFDCFISIKSLKFFCASDKFDMNSLKCFKNLTSLDISYNNLTELPAFLGELEKLTSLDISGNNLTELPAFLGELKSLTSIDISKNNLTEVPDFLGELKNLTYLDIGNNNLTELPDFLGELKNITSLNINGNNLTELPAFLGELENLTSLNIWHTNLTKLPAFLGELKNLTSLSIRGNNLTELPDFLRELKNLTSLSIRENNLTELPNFLGELKNLTYLYIHNNNLTELPDFLGKLKNLTSLNISGNNLTELPDFVGKLKNLTSLNISRNNLTKLPNFLGELKNLTSLDISMNNLTKLPNFLGELKNLTSLDIWNNNLTELPDFLGELKNLISLDLDNNNITELPYFFGELKNITSLNIRNNNLTKLPNFFGKLKNLTSFNISKNNLKELPDFLGDLKNLTSLDIWNNNLTELPDFLGQLKNLTSLDISNNNLTELTAFLGQLKNITSLNLSELDIKHIPKEIIDLDIVFRSDMDSFFLYGGINITNTKLTKMDISLFEQPFDVIKQFYKSELVELKECKMILLGNGEAGKTCLVERLIKDTFPKESPRTDGIIVENWNMPFDNGDNVKIKVLDFGGQEIMHSMHTCFLTSRSVYLVVLDARQDVLNDLLARNWMENIQTFAPDCPVIMVINKFDNDGNTNASLNESQLKDDYKNLLFVEKVSAKFGDGIDNLRKRIQSAIENSSGYNYYFNKDWINIKSELENMKEDYIKDTVYDKICEKYGVTDDYFKEALLNWFKDLGVSYFYKTNTFSPSNEKYRVLNPEWLTNGIYSLIIKAPSNTGLLTHASIRKILNKNIINKTEITYSDQEIEFILYVMRQYKISLEVDGDKEFIPSKLDKNKPNFEFDRTNALHLSWKAKYIPNIILHQLMVENYKKIDVNFMWLTGAIFLDCSSQSDCKYKVLIEKNDYEINLYVLSNLQEPRIHLESFRENLTIALKKIIDVEEHIHYIIDNKLGKENYDDVLTQYIQDPNCEIYLRDIKSKVLPNKILKQVFTDNFIQKEREEHMKNDFRNANIQNLTVTGTGDIKQENDFSTQNHE